MDPFQTKFHDFNEKCFALGRPGPAPGPAPDNSKKNMLLITVAAFVILSAAFLGRAMYNSMLNPKLMIVKPYLLYISFLTKRIEIFFHKFQFLSHMLQTELNAY